jgi:penicillin-binding protein 1A
MTVALKNRPNLKFIQPPDVTMASWDSGVGPTVDAFKPGQVPGASGPIGGSPEGAVATSGDGSPNAAGVDSGMGGLY